MTVEHGMLVAGSNGSRSPRDMIRPESADNMRSLIKGANNHAVYVPVGEDELQRPSKLEAGGYCDYCRRCFASVCKCLRIQLCILISIFVIIASVGGYSGFRFVRVPSRYSSTIYDCNVSDCGPGEGYLRTPANMTEHMTFPPCTSHRLKEEMVTFNSHHEWRLVEFPSREGHAGQDTVTIRAWWLPVKSKDAPRIVVVHGNDANFNDYSVQVTAYLLRSVGFAVLLPSLRDHGVSDNSTHRTLGWGWDYHLDVLGAWAYAVNDPDDVLGGKLEARKVGIMGFGLGAFAAAIALGLEKTIPGAWFDSVIFEPRGLLRSDIARLVGRPFAPLFTAAAWYVANMVAKVNITYRTPAAALRQAEDDEAPSRYIAISHDRFDAGVPQQQSDELVNLLANFPINTYSIEERWFPHAIGCGDEPRAVLPVWRPDRFRRKICEFWSGVFGRFANECNLDSLPTFSSPFNSDMQTAR